MLTTATDIAELFISDFIFHSVLFMRVLKIVVHGRRHWTPTLTSSIMAVASSPMSASAVAAPSCKRKGGDSQGKYNAHCDNNACFTFGSVLSGHEFPPCVCHAPSVLPENLF